MSHHQLDTCGLLCPLPVIRTQNRVVELMPGDTLEITATDPGVLHDIPAWSRVHGHEIVDTLREDNHIRIVIRVRETGTTP